MTKKDDSSEMFNSSNWPYIGVYIKKAPAKEIAARLAYAYESELPVYIDYKDWRDARNAHKVINFAENIGYVLIFTSRVNNRYIPNDLESFKLVDYKENINMSRHGLWSPLSQEYYEELIENSDFVWKDTERNFDYEFPECWASVNWKVKEL